MNQETKKEFFDAGASLLLYGSKRVYKKYLFFREFTSNPLIVNSKHNIRNLSLYWDEYSIEEWLYDYFAADCFGDLISAENCVCAA